MSGRFRSIIFLLPLLLLFFIFSQSRDNAAAFKLVRCFNEDIGEYINCGTLRVKENRRARKGAFLELNFVVLPALKSGGNPDAIFCFDGGPGGGAVQNIVSWAGRTKKIRELRDVVLLDQRGTGESNPLPCFPLEDRNLVQTWLKDMYPIEYVDRCRQELEEKANLRFYSTYEFVNDLDDLRAALGYEQVNVIGGSYGGFSGYLYMKYFPERVRCALLWSLPPFFYPARLAPDTQVALEQLLADCAQDPACSVDYPGLRQDFELTLNRLQPGPVEVSVFNPFTLDRETVQYRYNDFITGIRYSLYYNYSRRWAPAFIHWAAQGNYAPLIEFTVDILRSFNDNLMDGMFLCVQCTENFPFIDWSEAAALAEETFIGTYRLEQQRQACDHWYQGQLPSDFFDLETLVIPTLILSGEFDPVDPPQYSQQIADILSAGAHEIIPGHAHGVGGIWEDCLEQITARFIAQGTLDGIDLSCISDYKRRPFISWRDFENSSHISATVRDILSDLHGIEAENGNKRK